MMRTLWLFLVVSCSAATKPPPLFLQPKNLKRLYIASHATLGVVGVAAPEVLTNWLTTVELTEPHELNLAENLYSNLAGIALFSTLRHQTHNDLRAMLVAAHLPATFAVFKYWIKGSYAGYRRGFIPLELLLRIGCLGWSLRDPDELAPQILCGYQVVLGLLTTLDTRITEAILGTKCENPREVGLFRMVQQTRLILGILAYLLVLKKSSLDYALGVAAAIGAGMMVERLIGLGISGSTGLDVSKMPTWMEVSLERIGVLVGYDEVDRPRARELTMLAISLCVAVSMSLLLGD